MDKVAFKHFVHAFCVFEVTNRLTWVLRSLPVRSVLFKEDFSQHILT